MSPPDRIVSIKQVQEVLNESDTDYTRLFVSLMDSGRNYPWARKRAQILYFGPNENDFPGIGKRLSPFDTTTLPSPEDLPRILQEDIRTARDRYGDRLCGTREYQSVLDLLQRIGDPDEDGMEGLLSFPSPSLDEICYDGKPEREHMMRESTTTATILLRNTLIPLQHSSDGTTFTTLLSGSVAWFVWPPTTHNLSLLQDCYKNLGEDLEDLDERKQNVLGKLKCGMCMVQTVGNALRTPPFCLVMCLSLEKSVLAHYSAITATEFVNMLPKLPLKEAWFSTGIDGEHAKADFETGMLEPVESILKGDYGTTNLKNHTYPYTVESPLRTLLKTWDSVKGDVAGILRPANAEKMRTIWEKFLRGARGRECWICGESVHKEYEVIRKHFHDNHWLV